MKPLEGITVVSVEQAVAAPFASRQLAELGARVIKIERPDGGDFARSYDDRVGGLSSHFVWTNRSKESLTVDLKQEDGRDILARLIDSHADVLIQNLAPGAMVRLGFGYAKLLRTKPQLVVCDISGYGSDGPYRDKKAYDLLIQSESGFLTITGTKGEVCKAGASIADIAAGMYAYSNILAALINRGKTGRGCRLDISMLESLVEWMGYPLYYAWRGDPPPRTGACHATIYPYGPFSSGDDDVIMLGLQNEREWSSFCTEVLRRPELAEDERFQTNSLRSEAREQLGKIIADCFRMLSSDEIIERLEIANIANARVNDLRAVWDHPQLKARARWKPVSSPAGEVPAFVPPGANGADCAMGAIPSLGQHTVPILRELGFDDTKIADLKAAKVI